ncbi:MAG: NAD(P)/FAD-dependent oxidoreductase [Chloracidobacterium sp.]|nr:NAD(P)/FAD-dependent oxidoreductase [Chloracidobacterium sp.]MDW8217742.1 NAD(P)/FAD-dependent oxidoreductase [Acidobacteriota bacterium]
MRPQNVAEAVSESVFDVVVVGAGVAGLTAAALLQRDGYRTLLLEAHDKAGGCAGYFSHKGYTFDAGATVLMGLDAGGLHTQVLARLGVSPPESTLIRRVPVHLPDRTVNIDHDQTAWTRERVERFARDAAEAERLRAFWQLVDRTADAMWTATAKLPALPLRSWRDLAANLRLVSPGFLGITPYLFSTVGDVLQRYRLWDNAPLRAFLDGLLLITAQETADRAPFLNGAAGLDIYRHGIRRARGGMKAFIKAHVEAFRALGGVLKLRQRVTRITPQRRGGYVVETDRGLTVCAPRIIANLPIWNLPGLVAADLSARLARPLAKAGTGWGAFTLYLGVRAEVIPDDAPLNHQVLLRYDEPFKDGNSAFLSLSEPDDRASAPPGRRTLNVSTHTEVDEWWSAAPETYAARRTALAERLLTAVERVFPNIRDGIECVLPGTPVTFARYTGRARGMVGGLRTTLWNSNLFGIGARDVGLPNFWLVGDTVFPGQGTPACALSGVNAWRDITGCWTLDAPPLSETVLSVKPSCLKPAPPPA